jgi:hypothetical protein
MPDVNVVKLGLGNLGCAVDEVMTGDPTYCQGTCAHLRSVSAMGARGAHHCI